MKVEFQTDVSGRASLELIAQTDGEYWLPQTAWNMNGWGEWVDEKASKAVRRIEQAALAVLEETQQLRESDDDA
ncbi:MAG: hypothetical protein MI755_16570 [Sphingomonadales bacterium]|nr:hypothetical protein [Sphingomonadales bacterium]